MVDLLGKPIAGSHALCIPTAQWGHPMCNPQGARGFVAGDPGRGQALTGMGWASVGLLELSALPTVVQAVGAVGQGGRRPPRRRRRRDLPRPLDARVRTRRPPAVAEDSVWVGLSAGSMVMTPRIGPRLRLLVRRPRRPDAGRGRLLDLPHVGHPMMPGNTLADAERWAADLGLPAYAVDEQRDRRHRRHREGRLRRDLEAAGLAAAVYCCL